MHIARTAAGMILPVNSSKPRPGTRICTGVAIHAPWRDGKNAYSLVTLVVELTLTAKTTLVGNVRQRGSCAAAV
jgi:hypothetical protein